MNIRIIVITKNRELNSLIGQKKAGALPPQLPGSRYFSDKGATFKVRSFLFGSGDERALSREALKFFGNDDAALILLDQGVLSVESIFGRSAFIRKFNSYTGNVQNTVGSAVANALKEFAIVSRYFDDAKFQKIFLLPLRNFTAEELRKLQDLIEAGG